VTATCGAASIHFFPVSIAVHSVFANLICEGQFSISLLDGRALVLLVGMLLSLALLAVAGQVLRRQPESLLDQDIIRTFNNRVSGWLTITIILTITMMLPRWVTVVFFGLVSFWALREFIAMTPTRRADHRTLLWVLLFFAPIQYVLVGLEMYALYTVLIPVYASLFIPARIAFTGDTKRFLERTAKIQFGLLICVYALSHAPALLSLEYNQWDSAQEKMQRWDGKPAGLLLFLIVIVLISDGAHFAWDRLCGRHVIARTVNSTRTWEGLLGAAATAAVAGMLLHLLVPVTPFTFYGAGLMAMLISVMGSSGNMTIAAIKRDRGVKEYGTLVQGHAGVLDRMDSVCFAAPVFFHVTRYFLTSPPVDSGMNPDAAILFGQFAEYFHWMI